MAATTRSRRRLRIVAAEEIRAQLARKRMSGVRLAAEIGRSQAYVSRRLTGETAFDVDDLELIARVLEVHPAELLGLRRSMAGEDTVGYQPPPGRSSDPGPNGRHTGRSAQSSSTAVRRPQRLDVAQPVAA